VLTWRGSPPAGRRRGRVEATIVDALVLAALGLPPFGELPAVVAHGSAFIVRDSGRKRRFSMP